MPQDYLHWFVARLADGREIRFASHYLAEAKETLSSGSMDDLLSADEIDEVEVVEIKDAPDSKSFSVFGVYADNGYQRCGFWAKAQSPDEAEELAKNYATYACFGDPIIACVLEGEHMAVDSDRTFETAGDINA